MAGERLTVITAAHAIVDAHIVIVMIRLLARRQRRWRNFWIWVRIRVGRVQLECVVVLFAAGVAMNWRFWVWSWVWSFCNGTSKIIVWTNGAWRRPRLVFLRRFRSRQCQRLCLKESKKKKAVEWKIIDIVKRPPNKLNLLHSRLICRMSRERVSSLLEINLCGFEYRARDNARLRSQSLFLLRNALAERVVALYWIYGFSLSIASIEWFMKISFGFNFASNLWFRLLCHCAQAESEFIKIVSWALRLLFFRLSRGKTSNCYRGGEFFRKEDFSKKVFLAF